MSRRAVSGPHLALSPVNAVRAPALALLLVAACQSEPSILCDRVRLVWPYFDIDATQDTSPADGLQIDLVLRSSLLPGSTGTLTVQGETGDPVEHPQPAIAEQDGTLRFSAVTVPFGRVTLHLDVESECGDTQSTRTPYIWDGLGYPICAMDIGAQPAAVEELAPLGVLRADADADPSAPGLQLQVAVQAGRPDMRVSLFALDEASGEQAIAEQETGDDRAATFPVTLGEGEQALRAVCFWAPAELRPSSPTLRLWVDTEPPDCALVAPAGRVTAADDLDPDADGVQFEVRGRSGAADVAGEQGRFTVQGEDLKGSAVDEGGESSATATIVPEPGTPQEIVFRTQDRAGNPCEAAVTF